ncbi:Ribosomal RNA small subunit methyltransferase B [Lachnospiraceae bacterium TWA4]|nr:Ribosomal RNA small subunit methyltransferase B [Lachnospiraceae bacterium TWA4]
MINVRLIACNSIYEVLEEGKFSHLVMGRVTLDGQDRSFYTRLVKGTIERMITLDYLINSYSKTKVHKMKPYIRTILRMSAYQIYYMDQIPDHAVCNEAVKLTVKKGYAGLKGFVNGVLRTLSRQKESVKLPDDLSIQYSIPKWLVDYMIKSFGLEIATKMCKASLEEEKLSVWSPNKHLEGEPLPYGLNGAYVTSLENQDVLVQDVSSMIAGEITSPKEGDVILDVCAAPGGKAVHAALSLNGTGKVIACDLTSDKTALIEENKKRLKVENLVTKVHDARKLNEEWIEKADIVIADLPCSGLGIIGRKPEIKYRMSFEQVEELAKLQREILDVVWQYVKPGGRLVYSTCTWTPLENIKNYEWFLDNHPFIAESVNLYLPEELHSNTTTHGYLNLFAGVHKCDGFFISLAVRNK